METTQGINPKLIGWILRIAIAGEFIGHGVFALQGKEGWFKYFNAVGISNEATIVNLLLIVGSIDILLALLVLVKPLRAPLFWMFLWGAWTALLRPLAGDPIWDFIERFANWGAPLALFFLIGGWPKSLKEWFR